MEKIIEEKHFEIQSKKIRPREEDPAKKEEWQTDLETDLQIRSKVISSEVVLGRPKSREDEHRQNVRLKEVYKKLDQVPPAAKIEIFANRYEKELFDGRVKPDDTDYASLISNSKSYTVPKVNESSEIPVINPEIQNSSKTPIVIHKSSALKRITQKVLAFLGIKDKAA